MVHWSVDGSSVFVVRVGSDLVMNLNERSMNAKSSHVRIAGLRRLAKSVAGDDVLRVPLDVANVNVDVFGPVGVSRFDVHNLSPTVKALLDGFVDARVLVDDDCDHLPVMVLSAGGGSSNSSEYVFRFEFGRVVSRSVSMPGDDLFSAFGVF